MKKKKNNQIFLTIGCVVLFLSYSCIGYRNEFGKKRFIIKPSLKREIHSSFFQKVDTTMIYKTIRIVSKYNNKELKIATNIGLKFYGENKFSKFYTFDLENTESFNAKKASFGLYSYDGKVLTTKTHLTHPQGGRIIKSERILLFNNDTLILESKSYRYYYLPLPIPKDALEFQPDW